MEMGKKRARFYFSLFVVVAIVFLKIYSKCITINRKSVIRCVSCGQLFVCISAGFGVGFGLAGVYYMALMFDTIV